MLTFYRDKTITIYQVIYIVVHKVRTEKIEVNITSKNPSCLEANQSATYEHGLGVKLGTTVKKSS